MRAHATRPGTSLGTRRDVSSLKGGPLCTRQCRLHSCIAEYPRGEVPQATVTACSNLCQHGAVPKLFEGMAAERVSEGPPTLCTASSVSVPLPPATHRPDIAAIFIARYARGSSRTPCFAADPHAPHVAWQLAGGLEFGGGLGHRGAVRHGNGRRSGSGGVAPSTVAAAVKQEQATRARRYEQPPGAATGEEAVAVRTGSTGERCATLVDCPPLPAHASPLPWPAHARPLPSPAHASPLRSPAHASPYPRQLTLAPSSRQLTPAPCPRQLTPAPALASSR